MEMTIAWVAHLSATAVLWGSLLQTMAAVTAVRTQHNYDVAKGWASIVFAVYLMFGRHGRYRGMADGPDHEWERVMRVVQSWTWINLGAAGAAWITLVTLINRLID